MTSGKGTLVQITSLFFESNVKRQELNALLILILIWIPCVFLLSDRINLGGADCSSVDLTYQKAKLGCKPRDLSLRDNYETWSKYLSGTDMSAYISAGLGFADGKGIAEKTFGTAKSNYTPYYFQGAGTPFLIGCIASIFGQKNVYPYFFVIAFLRLLTAILVLRMASLLGIRGFPLQISAITALLAWSIIDFTFGLGLFASEAPAEPLIAAAILCLSYFLSRKKSIKSTVCSAIGFGFFLGLSSYFREIYGLFCYFAAVLIFLKLSKKKLILPAMTFVVLACCTLTLVQLPWKLRNQHIFHEFTMTGSQYYGSALLYAQWCDYREHKKWCANCGLGIGNYLRPDLSKKICADFKDREIGSKRGFRALLKAVFQQPRKAFNFKISGFDTLWFGYRKFTLVRFWCITQLVAFVVYACLFRKNYLEIYLFPLFILCLSPVIHYEPRFAFPIYEISTPLVWGMLSCKALTRNIKS